MEQYKKDFIEFMIDCQVLKFGDFVTKSGRKTPFFVNTGFYRTGAQLRKLGEYYAQAIKNTFGLEFDVLFGPAYKGIPLSVAATIALSEKYDADIRYCSNRKEVKDHGDKGILLGSPIADGGGWYSYVRKWYVNRSENIKIYFEYESYVPGKVAKNFEDVIYAIKNCENDEEKLLRFKKFNFDYTDCNNTKRIFEHIIMNEKK